MSDTYQTDISPGVLLRAMDDTQHKIARYRQLQTMTSDPEDIEMIRQISEEERRQLSDFLKLYSSLFGGQLSLSPPLTPQISSFARGVQDAFADEVETSTLFNNIVFTDLNPEVRNVFMRALQEDNKHMSELNYMLSKLISNYVLNR